MLYTARAPKPTGELDFALVWLILALLGCGLVMVYSSSIAIAEGSRMTGHQGHYFLLRQSVFILVALVAGAMAFQVPMRTWQQAAPYLFLAGLLLLVVVLIPGLGREGNGSRRWISLGFANLQPSELMKFFAVLYAADYTTRKAAVMHDFKKGFLPMAAVMLLTQRWIEAVPRRENRFQIRAGANQLDLIALLGHALINGDLAAPAHGPRRHRYSAAPTSWCAAVRAA